MSWRPRNESDEDRRKEAAILDDACASLGFASWTKLSETLYEIDAAMFGESGMYFGVGQGAPLKAWVEVKARDKLYDTVLLSAAKALQLYRLELATKLPAYFIIHVPDIGVLCHRIKPMHAYHIAIGGNDRGQNGDKEPCVFIDKHAFTLIAPPLEFN